MARCASLGPGELSPGEASSLLSYWQPPHHERGRVLSALGNAGGKSGDKRFGLVFLLPPKHHPSVTFGALWKAFGKMATSLPA